MRGEGMTVHALAEYLRSRGWTAKPGGWWSHPSWGTGYRLRGAVAEEQRSSHEAALEYVKRGRTW